MSGGVAMPSMQSCAARSLDERDHRHRVVHALRGAVLGQLGVLHAGKAASRTMRSMRQLASKTCVPLMKAAALWHDGIPESGAIVGNARCREDSLFRGVSAEVVALRRD